MSGLTALIGPLATPPAALPLLTPAGASSAAQGWWFTDLRLERHAEAIELWAAGRKDFYYQCRVTQARVRTNAMGPALAIPAARRMTGGRRPRTRRGRSSYAWAPCP